MDSQDQKELLEAYLSTAGNLIIDNLIAGNYEIERQNEGFVTVNLLGEACFVKYCHLKKHAQIDVPVNFCCDYMLRHLMMNRRERQKAYKMLISKMNFVDNSKKIESLKSKIVEIEATILDLEQGK